MLYDLSFYPQCPREVALPLWRLDVSIGCSALPLSGLFLLMTWGHRESGLDFAGGEPLMKGAWLSYSFSSLPAQGPGVPL